MNTCPTQERLELWLAERLSDADSLAIETHVERCTQICQPLLDSLSGFEGDLPGADATVATGPNLPPLPDLPGYELLSQLGSGGMGVVYKARHRYMSRIVAIKMLPSSVTKDAAAVARFNREVKAAAALRHPNIVATDNADEAGGVHFLVMEYVDGADLSALVKRKGPLPVGRAVDYVLQAARGLDYAHRHGVVHRDVKPANLLLDAEGTVKVLDMGVARLDSADGSELTELTGMGQIMGTVDYMAPEQALDTRRADGRADIYSLGITLWYLLTGRPAYLGESPLARLLAHREQPLPSLQSACSAAGQELETVFAKMAAKKPADRYQSMADVIAALEQYRADQGASDHVDPSSPGGGAAVATKAAAQQVAGAVGLEATVALRIAEADTDPNTERSLSLPAEALRSPPRIRGRKFAVATALVGLLAILAAAAYVVRVQTDNGEVVVESEVDGITVDIERNGEAVKDGWQIRQGADNRWVVRSGVVDVKLPANLRGEFTLAQDTARLVRNGKILVTITRKTKAAPEAAPIAAAIDRDRAAAEWVVAQGGKVVVVQGATYSPFLERAADLPAGRFELSSVMAGSKTLRNEDLQRFVGLDRLMSLHLRGAEQINDGAAPTIAKMTSIEQLKFGETQMTTSSLAKLAGLPRLYWLSLVATNQVDDHWAALKTLPLLRELCVIQASADDVRRLADVKQLRTVWLADAVDTDRGAAEELHAKNPLCRLIVGNSAAKAIGEDPVRTLAQRLQERGAKLKLKSFPIGENSVQSEDVVSDDRPVCIQAITMPPGCRLNEDDFPLLSCLTDLSHFEAPSAANADRYAAAFGEQAMLARTIDLSNSDLTDAGLATLAKLPRLESLDVQRTKVTQAGVDALQKALPECKIHWEAQPSTAPAIDRDRAAAEWVLELGGQAIIERRDSPWSVIESIGELPASPFKIISIVLAGNETVRNEDLKRFAGLASPIQLHLWGATHIDADAIPTIAKMADLQDLRLGGTHVRTSALAALTHLPRLNKLTISGTQADDRWASLNSLPMLRELEVDEASPDDVRCLFELKQLRSIWLPSNIDPKLGAEFRKTNPLCRLIVGTSPAKTIGEDPVRVLVERLRGRGAKIGLGLFQRSGSPSGEDAFRDGRPDVVTYVNLPPSCRLDADDYPLLSCLTSFTEFRVRSTSNANALTAALADQKLLAHKVDLSGSDLTDEGLANLAKLPLLEYLGVQKTKVTQAGVDSLQKALPECKILWDGQTSPVRAVDRDRAAAEWVVAQGGSVGYATGSGGGWAKKADELPAEPFQVNTANLWGVKTVRSTDLDRLVGLPRLEALYLVDTTINAEALSLIVKLPLLYSLRISGTRVKSSELAALVPMRRLAQLYLDARTQNDDDWAGLGRLSVLRLLVLVGASADDLHQLGKVKQLRTIWLADGQSPDEKAIADLQAANPLCRVLVGGGKPVKAIGRDPVGELAKCLRSKGADLEMELFPDNSSAGAATDADVAAGKPLNIISIKLPANASLDDEQVSWLSCPWSLHWFTAQQSLGADRYAAALAGQTMLWGFGVAGSDLTDAGLEHLKSLPSLVDLDVRATKVTNAGIKSLQKALPECKIHWAPSAVPSAASPVTIDRDRAAAEWVLEQGGKVVVTQGSDASPFLEHKVDLPAGGFKLSMVFLAGTKTLKNSDLERFIGLDGVWQLHLESTPLGAEAVRAIARMPSIEQLHIAGTQINTSALAKLADLPRLYFLSISAKRQVDDHWAGLKSLASFRLLHVVGASSDDLRSLASLKQLRTIWLPDVETVDEQLVGELQAANPLCRVLVGREAIRVVGRDPESEFARRLRDRGAECELMLFPNNTFGIPTDADLIAGKPIFVTAIKLPPSVSLDNEEIRSLACLCDLHSFIAYNHTRVDRCAAALLSQPRLGFIALSGSDLSDAGLEHLKTLPSLVDLDVRATKVTQAGIDSLQKALPECKILWAPPAASAAPNDNPRP